MPFKGLLRDVLTTFFKERPWEVDLRLSQDVRLGLPRNVRFKRFHDVRSGQPQNGQIGSLGEVLGTLEWEPIFPGSVIIFSKIFQNKSFLNTISLLRHEQVIKFILVHDVINSLCNEY